MTPSAVKPKRSIEKFVLPNGLRVHIERRDIPLCAAFLCIDVGRVTDRKTELAHVVEHIMHGLRSSPRANKGDLSYAKSNAFTFDRKTIYKFAALLPEDLPLALQILSRVLKEGPTDLVEREKLAVRQELTKNNVPLARIRRKITEQLFPARAAKFPDFAMRLLRIPEITKKDCVELWNNYYCTTNAVLVIIGNVPNGAADIQTAFGSIPRREQELIGDGLPEEPFLKEIVTVSETGFKDASMLFLAYRLPISTARVNLRKIVSFMVLMNYLKSAQGPLLELLRNKRNLCYSAPVILGMNEGGIVFEVSVETADEHKLKEIESSIHEVFASVKRKGLSERELLDLKKRFMVNQIIEELQFSENRIYIELECGFTEGDIESTIKEITVADIRDAAGMIVGLPYVRGILLPAKKSA